MTWKRWIVTSGLIATLAAAGSTLVAQEGDKPAEQPPAPQPKPEAKPEPPNAETQKPSFWGDHFALYLEAAYGSGSSSDVESSIESSATSFALSEVKLDDVAQGKFGIGWKLPADRGSFLISFTGYSEQSYTLDATGYKKAVKDVLHSTTRTSPEAYAWWEVQVDNGNLTAQLAPPVWVDTPRLEPHCPPGTGGPPGMCVDGNVTNDEVSPGTPLGNPYRTLVPDNVQNRLQTVDALFQREFGGRTWSGDWSAGLRYLVYEGNIPATAWLSITADETGFTDGAGLRLLAFNQDTTGLGPCGSLGLQYHLFRRRLTLFGNARFAFIAENLNVDSGNFFTTVNDRGTLLTVPARLEKSLSKTTWNLGGDLGAHFRIVDGFGILLAYNRTAYQDAVMLPFSIAIPSNPQEVDQGTVGLFSTKDLQFDTVRLGLTFQF